MQQGDDLESRAQELGHTMELCALYATVSAVCSCGWQSNLYIPVNPCYLSMSIPRLHPGSTYAEEEWRGHAETVIAEHGVLGELHAHPS